MTSYIDYKKWTHKSYNKQTFGREKKNLSLSKQKAFPYCLLDKVVCKAVNTWIDSTHGAAATSFKCGWVLAADY